jgi:hypothetical protein
MSQFKAWLTSGLGTAISVVGVATCKLENLGELSQKWSEKGL